MQLKLGRTAAARLRGKPTLSLLVVDRVARPGGDFEVIVRGVKFRS